MSSDLSPPIRPHRGAGSIVALALVASVASGASAQAQPPQASPDDFVAATAGANLYEVMAARLALVESKDERVRAFATMMLQDHGAALSALADAARRSGLKPPPQSVADGGEQLLSALQSLRGATFDRAYAKQQVLAHALARANEGAYVKSGSDPNLRTVAMNDLAMIDHHGQAAHDLEAAHASREDVKR